VAHNQVALAVLAVALAVPLREAFLLEAALVVTPPVVALNQVALAVALNQVALAAVVLAAAVPVVVVLAAVVLVVVALEEVALAVVAPVAVAPAAAVLVVNQFHNHGPRELVDSFKGRTNTNTPSCSTTNSY